MSGVDDDDAGDDELGLSKCQAVPVRLTSF